MEEEVFSLIYCLLVIYFHICWSIPSHKKRERNVQPLLKEQGDVRQIHKCGFGRMNAKFGFCPRSGVQCSSYVLHHADFSLLYNFLQILFSALKSPSYVKIRQNFTEIWQHFSCVSLLDYVRLSS